MANRCFSLSFTKNLAKLNEIQRNLIEFQRNFPQNVPLENLEERDYKIYRCFGIFSRYLFFFSSINSSFQGKPWKKNRQKFPHVKKKPQFYLSVPNLKKPNFWCHVSNRGKRNSFSKVILPKKDLQESKIGDWSTRDKTIRHFFNRPELTFWWAFCARFSTRAMKDFLAEIK